MEKLISTVQLDEDFLGLQQVENALAKRRQSEDYEELMDTFYLSENSGHSSILEHSRTDWIADYLHSRRSSSR